MVSYSFSSHQILPQKKNNERVSRSVALVRKLLFWNRVEIGAMETPKGIIKGGMSPLPLTEWRIAVMSTENWWGT